MVDKKIEDLIHFLNRSPTSWHAVEASKEKLKQHGFKELQESEKWSLEPGGRYFSSRQDSSLCAFVIPSQPPTSAHIIATHTDSPGFKLKPKAEFRKENMILFGLEVYGSPLISSWLNRDLGIAGQVSFINHDDKIEEALIRIDQHPIVIPQLAIHLDRQVNEQGPQLNKQDHLHALACLSDSKDKDTSYLEQWIKEQVNVKTLLAHDLHLFPLEPAAFIGHQKEMIASYRIDSVNSVHAALSAICKKDKTGSHKLKIAIFSNHEEIGSETQQGANSPYLNHQLERIAIGINLSREDLLRMLSNSLCVSVDLAHALHPNYPEKHEARHPVLMSKGIVIKYNAQQKYATDAHSAGKLIALCHQHHLAIQKFVTRGDIPCGSTIGPIHAHMTGIPTVDIGCAQLSMHSCRELASCKDHREMCALLEHFLD